jgi:hypothetical protein
MIRRTNSIFRIPWPKSLLLEKKKRKNRRRRGIRRKRREGARTEGQFRR